MLLTAQIEINIFWKGNEENKSLELTQFQYRTTNSFEIFTYHRWYIRECFIKRQQPFIWKCGQKRSIDQVWLWKH